MLLELNFRSKSEARWMNLERKAHSSIIIKHRCQNNLQHPQDPRNQNLKDDNANKPHQKENKKPQETNKHKQAKAKSWHNSLLYKIWKIRPDEDAPRCEDGIKEKFLQTETKEEEAKKNKPKKKDERCRHTQDWRQKNCVQCAKRGGKRWERERERERERKKRGIFAHFCFHPNLLISILLIQVRERGRDKRETL